MKNLPTVTQHTTRRIADAMRDVGTALSGWPLDDLPELVGIHVENDEKHGLTADAQLADAVHHEGLATELRALRTWRSAMPTGTGTLVAARMETSAGWMVEAVGRVGPYRVAVWTIVRVPADTEKRMRSAGTPVLAAIELLNSVDLDGGAE